MRRTAAAALAAVCVAAAVVIAIRVVRPEHLPTPGRTSWWTVCLLALSAAYVGGCFYLYTRARRKGALAVRAVAATVTAVTLAGALLTRPAWWPSLPELVGDVAGITGCTPGPTFELPSHGRTRGRGVLCWVGDVPKGRLGTNPLVGRAYLIALFPDGDARDFVVSDHTSSYPICVSLRDTVPLPGHHWLISTACGDSDIDEVRARLGGERFSMPG